MLKNRHAGCLWFVDRLVKEDALHVIISCPRYRVGDPDKGSSFELVTARQYVNQLDWTFD